MAKQRNYSTEFKRQVVLEYLAVETLYGLSKRHDISRNVIRLWIARYEADGELNDDTTAGDLLQDYKARIAALERLAGKLALDKQNAIAAEVLRRMRPEWADSQINDSINWVRGYAPSEMADG